MRIFHLSAFLLGLVLGGGLAAGAGTISFKFTGPLTRVQFAEGDTTSEGYVMGPALTIIAHEEQLKKQLSILSKSGGKVELHMATVEGK